MKPRKNTILIMLLGLLLVAFAVGIAQTPAQGDQKKKAEACCAMESCCCNDGSCPMKEDGTPSAEGCCSKHEAKHDKKNHDAKGSCCNVKHKDKTKAKQKA